MAKLSVIQLLRNRNPEMTKDQAAALVGCRNVYVDGELCTDPKQLFPPQSSVDVIFPKYVSRGGFKLEKALKEFDLDVTGLVMLDAGSSTGGFTDCLLQHGASKVYAVDSGTNQLAWSLRTDPRVVSMERCNFRYFDASLIPEKLDFACCDVSFISVSRILPVARGLLKDGASAVILIKPQFEARREQVGEGGIVTDPAVHEEVKEKCSGYAREAGFTVHEIIPSPIHGTKGNTEYLMLLTADN